ncbi:MAG: hypothetical protein GC164_10055 [Phycisphaera sp.]|nr:hypothetical protein [Phycisphaera sp.]
MTVEPMVLVIAGVSALTVALGVVPAWRYLERRWHTDAQWIALTAHRFSPDPVNVRLWVWLLNLGRAATLVALVVALPSSVLAVGLWLLLLLVPRHVVDFLWARRKARIDEQLPITITFLANSVGAGLSLVQAIERLADQAPFPVRHEFRIMANRYALGMDLASVIEDAKRRLELANFNLFASALLVNREMGGDIAATLRRIARSLERLQELKMNMMAQTSEGRTNIMILAVAPLGLLLLLRFIDAKGVSLLFSTLPGALILLAAAGLTATGVFWAHKLISSDM